MYSRAAVPHQSPRVYSYPFDIPSDRVVEVYRRMTDISKINHWLVKLTECRSQLALFRIYLKQSYTVSWFIMEKEATYIAYPDPASGWLDHFRSCTIEDLLIRLEFTRGCLAGSIPMWMTLVLRPVV